MTISTIFTRHLERRVREQALTIFITCVNLHLYNSSYWSTLFYRNIVDAPKHGNNLGGLGRASHESKIGIWGILEMQH